MSYKDDFFAEGFVPFLDYPSPPGNPGHVPPMVDGLPSNPQRTPNAHQKTIPEPTHAGTGEGPATAQSILFTILGRLQTLELTIYDQRLRQVNHMNKLEAQLAQALESLSRLSQDLEEKRTICACCEGAINEGMSEEDASDFELALDGGQLF